VPSVRSRLALVGLFGIFLIPVLTSSLSGLTHVITCNASTRTPFDLTIPAQGVGTGLSAETLEPNQQNGLCGGLTLDMGVQPSGNGKIRVILPISNHTRYRWRGSVKLVLGHTSVPIGVGEIAPGATRTGTLEVHVDPGTHHITGSLLIGP
jgi:hypothetical protein